jgi:hypothetical protein
MYHECTMNHPTTKDGSASSKIRDNSVGFVRLLRLQVRGGITAGRGKMARQARRQKGIRHHLSLRLTGLTPYFLLRRSTVQQHPTSRRLSETGA